jgi:hypothetical protein
MKSDLFIAVELQKNCNMKKYPAARAERLDKEGGWNQSKVAVVLSVFLL